MRNRPGVALMLVLWVIVVLGTIASSVAMATRSTTTVAANYRAGVTSRYAAESGIAAAVTVLEQTLMTVTDPLARQAYLNRLDEALGVHSEIALDDARAVIELVDLGTRLDINTADGKALAQILSFFTDDRQAAHVAAAIQAHLPLESIAQLDRIEGVPAELTRRASRYLTVDGDGSINRVTASDTVLSAASGDLREEPTRILIVSRGWKADHQLSHEIEGVYAIQQNRLVLVRWRERQL